MRRFLGGFIVLAAAGCLLWGCSRSAGGATGSEAAAAGKPRAVATLFPLYDFAKAVGGDKVETTLLLPPGVEAHSFEPSPQDIVRMGRAKLFLFSGEAMEPWVKGFLAGVKNPSLLVVDGSSGIAFLEDKDRDDPGHEHGGKDPHYWLDLENAKLLVANIAAAFAKALPENKAFFESRAAEYRDKLTALDARIKEALGRCERKELVYGGHFAFGYFAKRYGLTYLSPYAGFSPNAEPTPQKISELVKTLKRNGGGYIFYEELIDPKVAEVIAKEAGAKLLLLHGAHNVSKEELEKGVTYLEIMERNLTNLKIGLGWK